MPLTAKFTISQLFKFSASRENINIHFGIAFKRAAQAVKPLRYLMSKRRFFDE